MRHLHSEAAVVEGVKWLGRALCKVSKVLCDGLTSVISALPELRVRKPGKQRECKAALHRPPCGIGLLGAGQRPASFKSFYLVEWLNPSLLFSFRKRAKKRRLFSWQMISFPFYFLCVFCGVVLIGEASLSPSSYGRPWLTSGGARHRVGLGATICLLLLVPPLGSPPAPGPASLSGSGGDPNPPFHYPVVATRLHLPEV